MYQFNIIFSVHLIASGEEHKLRSVLLCSFPQPYFGHKHYCHFEQDSYEGRRTDRKRFLYT